MKKFRFALGLFIYLIILLMLSFVLLVLFWQYIASYEFSRVEGVMDDFMAGELSDVMDREIERYCVKHETAFESAEDISAVLHGAVDSGELSYRRLVQDSSEAPVYRVRLNNEELGMVYLRPYSGGPLAFGFEYWFPAYAEFDFDGFVQDFTVLAPEQAGVSVNGVPLTAENCAVSWYVPEELTPYAEQLSQVPGNARYSFSSFSDPNVSLLSESEEYLISEDESGQNTFTVTQTCTDELSAELYKYSEAFVRAYISYASYGGGTQNLLNYTIRNSALYKRILSTTDRLSWVRGASSSMSDLTVDSLQYYGCAATLEAHYTLTSRGMATDNNMKIILTQTDSGWRVAEIELF